MMDEVFYEITTDLRHDVVFGIVDRIKGHVTASFETNPNNGELDMVILIEHFMKDTKTVDVSYRYVEYDIFKKFMEQSHNDAKLADIIVERITRGYRKRLMDIFFKEGYR